MRGQDCHSSIPLEFVIWINGSSWEDEVGFSLPADLLWVPTMVSMSFIPYLGITHTVVLLLNYNSLFSSEPSVSLWHLRPVILQLLWAITMLYLLRCTGCSFCWLRTSVVLYGYMYFTAQSRNDELFLMIISRSAVEMFHILLQCWQLLCLLSEQWTWWRWHHWLLLK